MTFCCHARSKEQNFLFINATSGGLKPANDMVTHVNDSTEVDTPTSDGGNGLQCWVANLLESFQSEVVEQGYSLYGSGGGITEDLKVEDDYLIDADDILYVLNDNDADADDEGIDGVVDEDDGSEPVLVEDEICEVLEDLIDKIEEIDGVVDEEDDSEPVLVEDEICEVLEDLIDKIASREVMGLHLNKSAFGDDFTLVLSGSYGRRGKKGYYSAVSENPYDILGWARFPSGDPEPYHDVPPTQVVVDESPQLDMLDMTPYCNLGGIDGVVTGDAYQNVTTAAQLRRKNRKAARDVKRAKRQEEERILQEAIAANDGEPEDGDLNYSGLYCRGLYDGSYTSMVNLVRMFDVKRWYQHNRRMRLERTPEWDVNYDGENGGPTISVSEMWHRRFIAMPHWQEFRNYVRKLRELRLKYLGVKIPVRTTTMYSQLQAGDAEEELRAKTEKANKRAFLSDLYKMYKDSAFSGDVMKILTSLILLFRQRTLGDQALVLFLTSMSFGTDRIPESVREYARGLEQFLRQKIMALWKYVRDNFKSAIREDQTISSFFSKKQQMQSGDPDPSRAGSFFDTMASWFRMMNSFSEARFKDMMVVVGTLMSLSAAISCGQCVSADTVIATVDGLVTTTTMPTQFQRLLKGIEHFSVLLAAGAKNGLQGIAEWFKPAAQLSDVFDRTARLKFFTPKLANMNLGERAKFQDDLQYLKKWYADNKTWFESRAANQIYYLGKKDEMHKVVTEATHALSEFHKRTMRIAPLCVGVYGGTGIAKTSLVKMIARISMCAAGIDVNDESAPDRSYVFPPDGDFADGCSSAVQHVDLDDTGTLHPQITASKGGDKLIIALHRLVGNIPYFPNMAKLDDKGAVALHPVVVTASSNLEDFGAASTFVNHSIIGRRLDLTVEVQMNPKYRTAGNTADKPAMFAKNLEMIKHECTEAPDFWLVRVWQYEATNVVGAQPGKMSKYEIRGELKQIFPRPADENFLIKFEGEHEYWATTDEFYHFLGKYAVEHYAQQHAYLTVNKELKVDVTQYVPNAKRVFTAKGDVTEHEIPTQPEENDEIRLVDEEEEEESDPDDENERIKKAATKRVLQLPLFLNPFGFDTFNAWGDRVYRSVTQLMKNPWPNYGPKLKQFPGPEPLGEEVPKGSEMFLDAGEDIDDLEEDFDDDDDPSTLYFEMQPDRIRAVSGEEQSGDVFNTTDIAGMSLHQDLGGLGIDAAPVDIAATVTCMSYISQLFKMTNDNCYEVWIGMCGLVAFGTTVGHIAYTGCTWIENICSATSWLLSGPRNLAAGCYRSFREFIRDCIGFGTVYAAECYASKIWKWAKANKEVIAMVLGMVTLMTGLFMCYAGPAIVRSVTDRCTSVKVPEEMPSPDPKSENEVIMQTGGQKQNADTLHNNDTMAQYNDASAPKAKAVPIKGMREMPGQGGYASKVAATVFRKQIESNTWTCWLTHNGKIIPKTLASVFFVDNLTFVANEHVMQYRRLDGDVRLVLTHKWANDTTTSHQYCEEILKKYFQRTMDIPVKAVRWGTHAEAQHSKSDLVVGRLLEAPLGPMMTCKGVSDIPVVMFDMNNALPNEVVTNAVAGTQMALKTGRGVYSGEGTYFKNDGCKALLGAKVDILPTFGGLSEDIGNTRPGDCGKVHFADNVSVGGKLYAVILGVHTAIFSSSSGARTIFTTPLNGVREMIAGLKECDMPFNNGMSETQNGDCYHNVKAADLVDMHRMSVVNWVYNPLDPSIGKVNEKMRVIGGYPGFRSNPTTKIKQGPLWEHMDASEITPITGKEFASGKLPPDFKGKVDNGCGGLVDPVRAAHFKALVPLATQPERREGLYKRLKLVANGLVKRFRQNPEWEKMLGKVDMDEAINGAPGQRAKNPLNWSTSAGFPYHQVKSTLFEIDEESGKRTPKPELMESINTLHEGLKKGTVQAVFSAQLKDEPVSMKKRLQGKYRVFMMAPVDATIVTRMYLLNFLRVMQLFPYTFGACVGMNSASEQWTQLGAHLGIGSDMKIFDGDYKDFDKIMTEEVTDVVREMILELHKNSMSEEDLETLDNILKTTLSPVINFFGTFVKFPSMNPSGNSVTTQLNCLVNAILVRYAWTAWYADEKGSTFEEVAEEAGEVFDRDCRLATYGDDMVCSVKPEHSGFNCRTMHKKLKEIGIEFTDAAKNEGDNIQEFSAHEDITFLKRRFISVHVEGHNFEKQYLARLDYESIIKMIEWSRKSSTHTDLDILKSTLNSVGTEAYGHGERLFNATRKSVHEALNRLGDVHGIKSEDYLFRDYEHYTQWYKDALSVNNGVYKDEWYAPPNPDDWVKRATDSLQRRSLLPQQGWFNSESEEGRWSSDPEPDRESGLPVRKSVALANEEEMMKKIASAVCGEMQSGSMLTQFTDTNEEPVGVEPKVTDPTFNEGALGDFTLNEWFSRPTRIQEYTWAHGTTMHETFNPWKNYFGKTEIQKKLEGYSRLRARLHVKVMVNASPWSYGASVLSYQPLASNSSTDVTYSGNQTDFAYGTDAYNSVLTSRPHKFIYLSPSRGCEMVLPFVYWKNWVELDEFMQELDQMGQLTLASIVKLRSANDETTTSASLTVYAWAEDVELSGPSYVLQSGDYVPSHGMASALSGMMGMLGRRMSNILGQWRPNMIGNLANTQEQNDTEMLAMSQHNEVSVDSSTVGLDGVDHMTFDHILDRDVFIGKFTWNNTSHSQDTLLYVGHVTPYVSWAEDSTPTVGEGFDVVTGVHVNRLQMTPSCHLGCAFANWNGDITYRFTVVASQLHRGRIMLTYDPEGHRFGYNVNSYKEPFVISKIWDLQESPDFEFTVPYASSRPYLTGSRLNGVCFNRTPIKFENPPSGANFMYKSDKYNGSFRLSVMNPLVAAKPNTEVEIMVRLNCKGVRFHNPVELDVPISQYQLQSGDCSGDAIALAGEPGDEVAPEEMDVVSKHYDISDVCMGESIYSLRQLMRRAQKYRLVNFTQFYQKPRVYGPVGEETQYDASLIDINKENNTMAYSMSRWFYTMPPLPLLGGGLPHAIEGFVEGTVLPATWPDPPAPPPGRMENQTQRLPTVTAFFAAAYLGWRGSHVYKAQLLPEDGSAVKPTDIVELSLSRSTYCPNVWFSGLYTHFPILYRAFGDSMVSNTFPPGELRYSRKVNLQDRVTHSGINNGLSGMTQTAPFRIPFTDAVFPYCSPHRMMPTNQIHNYEGAMSGARTWDPLRTTVSLDQQNVALNLTITRAQGSAGQDIVNGPRVQLYHAAGQDFSLFYYLNPPTYYYYDTYTGELTQGYAASG